MEIHHHPEVEKKGFKEYLLEGLMIFLAVTMGFFAETIREGISERNRAAEYAVGLLNDLKADTANLHGFIRYFTTANANVDSLMNLLSDHDPRQVPPGKLYWYGLWGGATRSFIPHRATLLEMESSGSLRFFATPDFKRKLEYYDQLCGEFQSFDNQSLGVYTEVRKIRAQLFEFKYNDITNNITRIKNNAVRQAKIDSFIKTKPPLLSYDKTLFNEYVELVRSRFFKTKVNLANALLRHATLIIGDLKRQYKLEDE